MLRVLRAWKNACISLPALETRDTRAEARRLRLAHLFEGRSWAVAKNRGPARAILRRNKRQHGSIEGMTAGIFDADDPIRKKVIESVLRDLSLSIVPEPSASLPLDIVFTSNAAQVSKFPGSIVIYIDNGLSSKERLDRRVHSVLKAGADGILGSPLACGTMQQLIVPLLEHRASMARSAAKQSIQAQTAILKEKCLQSKLDVIRLERELVNLREKAFQQQRQRRRRRRR